MTLAYYNENDPYCAQWLRNLISQGLIAKGEVDERSIEDIKPWELKPFTQCHFFAGIGGWSCALRLADIPDRFPVWTGSCPCQPFSSAGKGGGFADERHLWPAWLHLIRVLKPATILGEQVTSQSGLSWLDLVCSDLEGEGYACGAAVLPACSVGAPHIRQRLWFVADADGVPASAKGLQRSWQHGQREENGRSRWMGFSEGEQFDGSGGEGRRRRESANAGELGNTLGTRLQEQRGDRLLPCETPGTGTRQAAERTSPWSNLDWLPCTDGKARPVKSGIFPLAHGVSARVGRLRAAGNAIVPQVAAEFIKAALEKY